MKLVNYKLLTIVSDTVQIGFIPYMMELSQLRTGVKIGSNVAYTLIKATEAQEIVNTLKKGLEARIATEKEQVELEWTELMNQESEFDARPIKLDDLMNILDKDKITAQILLNLGEFITTD